MDVLTERVDRLVNDPHQAITARTVGQLYNPRSGMRLPDRVESPLPRGRNSYFPLPWGEEAM